MSTGGEQTQEPLAQPSNDIEYLTVALLSDMHAYAKNRNGRTDEPSHLECGMRENDPNSNPVVGLEELIAKHGLEADLLLCGGDLGDKADVAGVEFAWKQVQRLGGKLGAQQVIATAGNHDLDSRYQDTQFTAQETLKRLRPRFPVDDIAKCNEYWGRNFTVLDAPHCRVVTLNSCAYHGQGEGERDRGRVSDYTLTELGQELRAGTAPKINILLCHHHPVYFTDIGDDSYDAIVGGQGLLDLLRNGEHGRWIVIHGHRHMPHLTYALGGASSPVIFSAASFSVDLHLAIQARSRNQFYLLRFPLTETRSLELSFAGRFRSWYWVPRSGWEVTPPGVSLPAEGGFGFREDPRLIATAIRNYMINKPRQSMTWDELIEVLPRLGYVIPEDIALTRLELEALGAGLRPGDGRHLERVEFP